MEMDGLLYRNNGIWCSWHFARGDILQMIQSLYWNILHLIKSVYSNIVTVEDVQLKTAPMADIFSSARWLFKKKYYKVLELENMCNIGNLATR